MQYNAKLIKIMIIPSPASVYRLVFGRSKIPLDIDTETYDEHKLRTHWKRVSHYWLRWSYPLRPSTETIAIYRDFISRKKGVKRILILGSTPEMRDLASEEADTEIWVADFSKEMLTSMLQYTRRAEVARERWVQANWLNLPFQDGFFDIVMGDIVMHQVPPKLEKAFLESVRRVLKRDGYFISRFLLATSAFVDSDARQLTESVLTAPMTTWQKVTFLTSLLSWRFVETGKRWPDLTHAAEELMLLIDEFRPHAFIVRNTCSALRKKSHSSRNWAPPLERDFPDILEGSFRVVGRHVADDCIQAHIFPVYALLPQAR
jgi:SAM-dependent methyltransferase